MNAIAPSKLVAVMAAATFFAAAPIGLHLSEHALSFSPASAEARQGADDKTAERHGRHADDTKPDDRGGRGRHGADDTRPDDHGGKRHR